MNKNDLDEKMVKSLTARYPNIHPLIFHRSIEYASGPGELFDILEEMPKSFPIIWDDSRRKWVITDDLFQTKNFKKDSG